MPERQGQAAMVVTPVVDQKGRAVDTGETYAFVDWPKSAPRFRNVNTKINARDSCTRKFAKRMHFHVSGVGAYRFYLPSEVASLSTEKQSEYLMDTLCAAYKRLGHLEREYRDILEMDGEL